MPAYDEDLAAIHDSGWLAVAEAGARALVEILAGRGIMQGLVIELGCGSGASSRILTDAGYDVLGIDVSPAMIELARARAPSATFVVGSFVDAALPECVAVTAFSEVLNYRFDERAAEPALAELFARISEALRPGGVFLFDTADPTLPPSRSWRVEPGWAVLASNEIEGDVLTRHIITFRSTEAGTYRRAEETHVQQLYEHAAVRDMLREAGFGVRLSRRYGTLELAPHLRAFTATKGRS